MLLTPVSAQEAVFLPASVQSLGNNGASLPYAEAFEFNPASITSTKGVAGIAYSNQFLLSELTSSTAFAVFPVFRSSLQLAFSQFGYSSYRENQLSMGLGKKLGKHFSAGVRMQYFRLAMAENDRYPSLTTFSLGIQYQQQNVGFGLSVFNPLNQAMKELGFQKEYPVLVRIGANRLFNRKLLFVSALSIESGEKLNSHWGIECRFSKRFCARAGLETASATWSLGTGWEFGALHADLAFAYHQYLGSSPSVTIYLVRP